MRYSGGGVENVARGRLGGGARPERLSELWSAVLPAPNVPTIGHDTATS